MIAGCSVPGGAGSFVAVAVTGGAGCFGGTSLVDFAGHYPHPLWALLHFCK